MKCCASNFVWNGWINCGNFLQYIFTTGRFERLHSLSKLCICICARASTHCLLDSVHLIKKCCVVIHKFGIFWRNIPKCLTDRSMQLQICLLCFWSRGGICTSLQSTFQFIKTSQSVLTCSRRVFNIFTDQFFGISKSGTSAGKCRCSGTRSATKVLISIIQSCANTAVVNRRSGRPSNLTASGKPIFGS